MINAKTAIDISNSNNNTIYCGALSVYRNMISNAIVLAASDRCNECFISSNELFQNTSELSKMIFREIENSGYKVNPHYTKKNGRGIIINW